MKVLSGIFQGFVNVYRLINILSIDVAIGACIMAVFIAGIFAVQVPFVTLIALGLSVWIIYTVDHLNDARSIPHVSHTKRHYFHQHHFVALRAVVAFALLIQAVLLFFLPPTIIVKGFFMVMIVVVYFLLLWFFKYRSIYHKEIIISAVYTSGVFLPTFNLLDFNISYSLIAVFLQVGSLAFCNLLLFAFLEMKTDRLDHQSSIALSIGAVNTKRMIYVLLTIGVLIAVLLFIVSSNVGFKAAQLVFILMYLLSFGIFTIDWFRKYERFRYWGDALFFLPLLQILWL